MTNIIGQDKPSLEETLEHYGVKGMHWGQRKSPEERLHATVQRQQLKSARDQTARSARETAQKSHVAHPSTQQILKARKDLAPANDAVRAARQNFKVSKAQYRVDKEAVGRTQAKIILEKNGKLPLAKAKAHYQAIYDVASKETGSEMATRIIKDILRPKTP